MSIGFPAYYKDRRALVQSVDATNTLVFKILEILEWEEIGLHSFAFDYRTKGTLLNSGERFYINVTETEIILRSECMFFTQIIDFGKNKSNIQSFWAIYDDLLAQ